MVNHIAVNGRSVAVLNTLSCGPGCAPSTYELAGGAYVYAVGSSWWMQERGRDKRQVVVTAAE
jgi:hypothetical protein